MEKKNIIEFLNNSTETLKQIKTTSRQECINILKQLGSSVEFEEEDDRPVYNSYKSGEDDVVSAEIRKVYLKDNYIYVDVDFYYLQDFEDEIFADDEPEFDYLELLRYLVTFIDD